MSGKPALAFLGTGIMGAAMVARLIERGYPVAVWNRSPEKLADLLAAGATRAESPAAAASGADLVLMCLTNADAAEAVVFGPDGVAAGGRQGQMLVDFSSLAPDRARAMAARLKEQAGMDWLDAPVSGGAMGAREGSLAVMVGGAASAFETARPVIAELAGSVTHMGPSGAGQTTKLCNQIIVSTQMAAIAEAVKLAEAGGVDALKLTEALKGGWADSKPLQVFVPRMARRDFEPPIGTTWMMLKDLDTVTAEGRAASVPLPVTTTVAELMRVLAARGEGDSEPLRLVTLGDGPR